MLAAGYASCRLYFLPAMNASNPSQLPSANTPASMCPTKLPIADLSLRARQPPLALTTHVQLVLHVHVHVHVPATTPGLALEVDHAVRKRRRQLRTQTIVEAAAAVPSKDHKDRASTRVVCITPTRAHCHEKYTQVRLQQLFLKPRSRRTLSPAF